MAIPLLVAAVGILSVFVFVNRGITEPTVESTVARYANELRAIGTEVPVPANAAPNWTQLALGRLASLKASIKAAESIARDLEHGLAARSSACALANAAGDTIAKELEPARMATTKALDGLLSETKDRLKALEAENNTLGWVGWRGSREEAISGLVLLAHEIEMARTSADLAFTRLKNEAVVLSRLSVSCE